MKKQWIALLLAAVMLCALSPWAQAEEASVLDRIAEANQLETILLSSPRVGKKEDMYDAQGNITSWYYYADESLQVRESNGSVTIYQNGQVFGFDNEEKRPFLSLFLDNTQEEYTDSGISYYPLQEERVLTCTEDKGELAVQTVVDDTEILDFYQQLLFELGYENAQLERICYSYVLDAQTYRIKSETTFTELADGSTLLLSEVQRLEEPQPYEIDPQLLDMLFSQDKRTVTVIADPGTADENVYEVQVGKGCEVYVFPSAEHPNLYLDAACTQPVEFIEDFDSDLLIYTLREAVTEGIQPYPEEEQCPACDTWYEVGTAHTCTK